MTIQFRCQCGRAYQVADDWAGRGVKCNQCGKSFRIPAAVQADPLGDLAQLEATSAAAAPLQSPAPQFMTPGPFPGAAPRSKPRLPTVLKIVIPLAGGVVLLLLLTVALVMWAGKSPSDSAQPTVAANGDKQPAKADSDKPLTKDRSGQERADSSKPFDTKYAPARDPFAEPSANSKIIVTDENWAPDPKQLDRLHAATDVGPFRIRLPKGFKTGKTSRGNGQTVITWTRLNSKTGKNDAIAIYFNRWPNSNGPTKEEVISIDKDSLGAEREPENRLIKVVRGRCKGLASSHTTYQHHFRRQDKKVVYLSFYQIYFRDYNCSISAMVQSPPGSDEYKLINTAILSLHRH